MAVTDKEKKYPDWWYQSPYQKELDSLAGQIEGRPDFKFKVDQEAIYDYYKGEYDRQGQEAKLDTQAKGAALTGGYGNSYARQAGQRAYDGQMDSLREDVVPDLWQMALDKYTREGEALVDRYEAVQKKEKAAYDQWEKEHKDEIEALQRQQEQQNAAASAVDRIVGKNNRNDPMAQYMSQRVDQITAGKTTKDPGQVAKDLSWEGYRTTMDSAIRKVTGHQDFYDSIPEAPQYADSPLYVQKPPTAEELAQGLVPYESLTKIPDFLEQSQYEPKAVGAHLTRPEMEGMTDEEQDRYFDAFNYESSQEDLLYEAVNGNFLAMLALNSNGYEIYEGLDEIYRKTPSELMQLTAQEISVFNYLYKTLGLDAAKRYLNYLASDLSGRQIEAVQAAAANRAQKQPFLSSVDTIITSPFRGQIGTVGVLSDLLEDGKLSTNADYNMLDYQANAVRGKVSEMIEKQTPFGKVGSFLYGAGMSIGDSLARMVASAGNPFLSAELAACSAGVSTISNAKNLGLNDAQALALGVIAGFAEGFFEKHNLEDLLNADLLKDGWKKYILKNATNEATEEVSTELVNTVADIIIGWDKGQMRKAIDAYKAQGLDAGQASLRAFCDKLLEIGEAGAMGFLTGGLMSGTNVALNSIVSTAYKKSGPTQAARQLYTGTDAPAVNTPGTELSEGSQGVDTDMGSPNAAWDQAVQRYVQEGQTAPVVTIRESRAAQSDTAKAEDSPLKAASKKYGAQAAMMENAYREGQDVDRFDREYKLAYDMGKEGASRELMDGGAFAYLTAEQKNTAYQSGAAAAENTGIVAEAVKSLGITGENAGVLTRSFNANQITARNYAMGLQEAYEAGKTGIPLAQAGSHAAKLTEQQRQIAYKQGQKAHGKQVAKQQAQARKNRNAEGADTSKGKVHFEGDRSSLNKTQRASLDAVEVLAKTLGVQIYVFESEVDENGNHVGANGWYDPSDGSIHIDLYAGNSGKGTMLFTVAHELTHFIKQWSPAKFEVLANLLTKQYTAQGQSVSELVEAQQDKAARNGRELDYDAAYEEMVADSMESMLSDGSIIEMMAELKQQDRVLWQKICEWFKDLAGKLRAVVDAYKGVRPDSTEGRLVADMKDMIGTLEALYMDALVDASENFDGGVQKITTEDSGGVKYSLMAFDKDGRRFVEIDQDQDRFDGHNADEYPKIAKTIINEKFNGHVIGVDNKMFVNGSGRDEFANPSKHLDSNLYETKMRTAGELDNLLDAGANFRNEPDGADGHIHPDVIGGFDYFDTLFKIGNKYFSAVINIKNVKRGKLFKDVTKIKDVTQDIMSSYGNNPKSQFLRTSSKDSIRNPGELVNKKFSDRDSTGNQLSAEQQEYFKGSKERDNQGRLRVMYRGDSTEVTVFDRKKSSYSNLYGRGFYFTNSASHAGQYGQATAYYLNITNPVSTTDCTITKEQMRKFLEAVAENEDDYSFENYGYGATIESVLEGLYTGKSDFAMLYDVSQTAIGDMVEAVELFNKTNGTNYDGFILDTETVIFNSAQAKRTDNHNPTANPDTRFSLREPVERTKNLVAVHNLSEEKLLKSLKLGGLPMPSIAIIRAQDGHGEFGDISLVFGKDTVDPEVYRANKLYSGDAWTPMYPKVDYKPSEKVLRKVKERISGLVPYEVQSALGSLMLDMDNASNNLDRFSGNMVEVYKQNDAMKYAYLKDTGSDISLPMKEADLYHYGDVSNAAVRYFSGKLVNGLQTVELYRNMRARDVLQDRALTEAVADAQNFDVLRTLEKGSDEYLKYERNPVFSADEVSFADVDNFLSASRKLLTNGVQQTVDRKAAKELIRDAVDQTEYENWLEKLFSGVVEKEGIRNNKDYFTPSGNRRSFEALHYEHNLENVIKAMRADGEKGIGNGFGGASIFGASTTEYSSIEDMKRASNRLQMMPYEEYQELRKQFTDRFLEIVFKLPNQKNSFSATDSAAEVLTEAVAKYKTRSGIANYLRRELKGWATYSEQIVDDLIALVNDIQKMPTGYFEAKPRRAVSFEEVTTAIVPDSISNDLRTKLEDMGIKFVEYPAGDEEARKMALNSLEDVKFSNRDPDRQEIQEALEKENAKLREDVAELRELVKLQRQVTNGTKFTKTSVEAAARYLKQNANAKGDTKELSKLLNGLYEYIASAKELTWEGVKEQAQGAADWLWEHIDRQGKPTEYAQDILKQLHGTRVYLDESQMAEAAYRFGSYDAFRKGLMGNITLAKNANTSLDSLWAEFSEMYPDVFDSEVSAADMPSALVDIIHRLRSPDTAVDYARNREMMEQELLQEVYDSYWRVSTLYTPADVGARRINKLKSEHYQRMEKLKQDHREAVDRLKQAHQARLEQVRKDHRAKLEEKVEQVAKRYQDARKQNVEGRKKTEQRRKIRKTIRELSKLLAHGTKERNIKEGMKDFVSTAIASAEVLFTDEYTNEDMVRNGVACYCEAWESSLLDKTRALIRQRDELLAGATAAREVENVIAGDLSGYEQRMKEVRRLERKISENMGKLRDVFVKERARMNEATASSLLNSLAEEYWKLGTADEEYIRGALDENVHQHLMNLSEEIGGTTVKDMSLSQLEQLHRAYTMVLTTVRNANKSFAENLKGSRMEQAKAVTGELAQAGKKRKKQTRGQIARAKRSWNNLKSVYAFERIGSGTLRQLYENLRGGEDTWMVDMDHAREHFLKAAKDTGYNGWDLNKQTYSFESSTGLEFSLNLGQIMSIYAYARRGEQALDHLMKGGFVFDKYTEERVTEHGIPKTYLKDDATAYNLSLETIQQIISKLTPEQRTFVETMQDYLSDTMGGKGNEVSMKLYGVKLFGEKNYFPLRSSGVYLSKAADQEMQKQQGQVSVKNAGFTHSTTPNAANPVVLSGFMDVWANHVNDMSMYHAFVLPMEDFNKVYNYSTPHTEESQSGAVKQAIVNAHGSAATDYINQFIRDLNGGVVADPREGQYKAWISKFKKASVMASASVVIQQPTAIVRALAYIDPKYFGAFSISRGIGRALGNKITGNHTQVYEELKKYAPVAAIKQMGRFDTDMGMGAVDYLTAKEFEGFKEQAKALFTEKGYLGKRMDEVTGFLAERADEITWAQIWQAVKNEVADKQGLKMGSEAHLQAAGKRFTEVITRTQVYDSVFSRSANMRAKTGMMSMVTSFMAEPTTTANMLTDAIRKAKQGDVKHFLRVGASVAGAIIFNNILRSAVYAMRDDDEDETFVEKYLQALTGGVFDDVNPMSYLPFWRDVWSLVQRYDVERADMSVIATLMDAAYSLADVMAKDTSGMTEEELAAHEKKKAQKGWSFADALASAVGLPMKNVRRDILGAVNFFATIKADGSRETTSGSLKDKVWEDFVSSVPGAKYVADLDSRTDDLYDAIVAGDNAYMERLKSGYKSEQSYLQAVRKGLRENDGRIRAAAVARMDGELESYMSIAKEIIAEGNFTQDDVVAAINAVINELTPSGSSSATKAKGLFDTNAFAVAISQDDTEMAKMIQADIIRTAQRNGKSEEEAEKSFISSVTSACKEMFGEGDLSEEQAVNALMDFCEKDEVEARASVAYWEFSMEYPDVGASAGWFETYCKKVENSGIAIEDYVEYRNRKTGYSKRAEVLKVIDGMSLTKAQKDALYRAEGYAESTLDEAPWH